MVLPLFLSLLMVCWENDDRVEKSVFSVRNIIQKMEVNVCPYRIFFDFHLKNRARIYKDKE